MDKISFKGIRNVGACTRLDFTTKRPTQRIVLEFTNEGFKDLIEWKPILNRFKSPVQLDQSYLRINRLADIKNPLKFPPFFSLNNRIIPVDIPHQDIFGRLMKLLADIAENPYHIDKEKYPNSALYRTNYDLLKNDRAEFDAIHNFENVRTTANLIIDDIEMAVNNLNTTA